MKITVKRRQSLEKTRGRLTAPNLVNGKMTRPDQEIRNIDTPRQADIAAGHFTERSNGLSRDHKEFVSEMYHSDIGKQAQEHAKAVSEAVNAHGIKAHPEEFMPTGSVGSNHDDIQQEPIGVVNNEGSYHKAPFDKPTRTGYNRNQRREHEGIHLLVHSVGQKYGKKAMDNFQNQLNSFIHPDDNVYLRKFLYKIGYHPDTHRDEMVTHLYEILHDKKTRDMFMKFGEVADKQETMKRLGRAWNAIRDYGQRVQRKDV